MKIIKVLFFIFIFSSSLFSSEIIPNKKLTASGAVTHMKIQNNLLYVATSNSKVDIFDLNTQNLINSIEIEKVKDFMGDLIPAKIYSVDALNKKVLFVSQGKRGARNIYLYENGKLKKIISDDERMFIVKASFINENTIIFSLLSNQLFLYDLKANKNIYFKQISQSKFSNFALNASKDKIAIVDESGILRIFETSSGKLLKNYENQNLDNVFQVDWKKDRLITAGQDRRCVVYNEKDDSSYYKKVDFLIYSCGLSPSAKLAGFASDENNNVTIFNTNTKDELYKLTKNKMTLTNILFINEKEVLVSSDDKVINYYILKD